MCEPLLGSSFKKRNNAIWRKLLIIQWGLKLSKFVFVLAQKSLCKLVHHMSKRKENCPHKIAEVLGSYTYPGKGKAGCGLKQRQKIEVVP